ncbi:hypothetical protein SEA_RAYTHEFIREFLY_68 [Gordonia phage RayTheFireFly]|nr:hypothetical protein SEA_RAYTHEFIREFLY_68 [Gordonia phage RayTheFireFly]
MMYPPDHVGPDEDDGTMPDNVDDLRHAVIGRRIVSAEQTDFRAADFVASEHTAYWSSFDGSGLVLTLNDGRRVALVDTSSCCAYTDLQEFFLNPDLVDHAITGVATTDGYTTWHIYADLGDIMRLKVGWSAGNPFYYGYGFDIGVSTTIEGSLALPEIEGPSHD